MDYRVPRLAGIWGKRLFSDIKDNRSAEEVNLFLMFILGVTMLSLIAGSANNLQISVSTGFAAVVFALMLLTWGVFTHTEIIKDSAVDVWGVGKNWRIALIAGIALALVAWFAAKSNPSFSLFVLPFSTFKLDQGLLTGFFVITAGFIEANFFRGFVFPHTISFLHQWLKVASLFWAGVYSLIIQSAAFALFHVWVRGSVSVETLLPVFIFGLVAGVGVAVFRSIAFEYGLHVTNNALYLFLVGGSLS